MYQIGDIVVYGTEGIAEIGEEIEREFDGQKLKYLVLHPLEKKTETVYVPVGNEKAMRKLRSILREEEAETLIDALPPARPDGIKHDRERQKVYRDTLLFGSSREVLAMARALYLHQVEQLARGKKLHASDERFMRDAEKMIFGELAYVLGITQEEVLQRLVRLEKSSQK